MKHVCLFSSDMQLTKQDMKKRSSRNICAWITILFFLVFNLIFWQGMLWENMYKHSTSEAVHPIEPQLIEPQPVAAPLQANQDGWREMLSSQGRIFLYSAYLDLREMPVVKVIAILVQKRHVQLYCHLVTNKGDVYTVNARLTMHKEAWKLEYSSYFIECQLENDLLIKRKELLVGVSEEKKLKSRKNLIQVHQLYPVQEAVNNNSFAVCVKPLHYYYDRAVWLVEFIELHRILGVQHFYFYNHTVGPSVERVLRLYKSLQIITILPWQLDLKSQKEIRTEGMFASLNDCLYRTIYNYQYVIFLDFDEYIIPKKAANYGKMMNNLKVRNNIGSFVFQNAFFYLYWENYTSFLPDSKWQIPYLITLFKVKRKKDLNPYRQRSKYIVKPENCVMVGNHFVWKHVANKISFNVPPDIGLSHHYRICEFGGYSCLNTSTVIDKSTWRHAKSLISNVHKMCLLAFPVNGACPQVAPLGSAF